MRPDSDHLVPAIEAVLFAADQPVAVRALAELFDNLGEDEVRAALDDLRTACDAGGRGVQLAEIAGGVQLVTRERYAAWVDLFLRGRRRVRLSRSALEALAIIAYKQPVTKVEVDEIRGVDSSGVIATLLERGLIAISGRAPGVGRPLLYSTSVEFLSYFGLASLDELPRLSELTQLMETNVVHAESATEEPTAAIDDVLARNEGRAASGESAGEERDPADEDEEIAAFQVLVEEEAREMGDLDVADMDEDVAALELLAREEEIEEAEGTDAGSPVRDAGDARVTARGEVGSAHEVENEDA
jgi:segregation and condensation protein B